jgi:hypothetical protein
MRLTFRIAGYLTKPPKFSKFKDIVDKSEGFRFCLEGEDYMLYSAA